MLQNEMIVRVEYEGLKKKKKNYHKNTAGWKEVLGIGGWVASGADTMREE